MTDWTPQNNSIANCLLSSEDFAVLQAAKHGWVRLNIYGHWNDDPAPAWQRNQTHRAKPAPVTQDVVPGLRQMICDLRARQELTYTCVRADKLCVDAADMLVKIADLCDSLQQRPVTVGAVTEPLADGQEYWVPCPASARKCDFWHWTNSVDCQRRLREGLIYLTQSDAVAAAKTMCAKGGV